MAPTPPRAVPPPGAAPTPRAGLALLLAAMVLHAAVWRGLQHVWSQGEARSRSAPEALPRAAWVWRSVADAGEAVDPVHLPPRQAAVGGAQPVAPPATPPAPPATPVSPVTPGTPAPTVPDTAPPHPVPAPDAPPDRPTEWAWPPAATLTYRVTRGALSGQARLDWQPADDGYRLTLGITWDDGGPPWHWHSEGALDPADGVVPRRFLDRRGRRGARALSFAPGTGGGRQVQASLRAVPREAPPQVQDRLSWLARLAADPGAARHPPPLSVAGPAGELQDWTWRPDGPSAPGAWHRLPRQPYDTAVGWQAGEGGWPRLWSLSEARGPALTLHRVGDPSTSGPDLTILGPGPGDGGP
jgi:hypothetical protein